MVGSNNNIKIISTISGCLPFFLFVQKVLIITENEHNEHYKWNDKNNPNIIYWGSRGGSLF